MTGFSVFSIFCSTLFDYKNISAPAEYHITQASKTE